MWLNELSLEDLGGGWSPFEHLSFKASAAMSGFFRGPSSAVLDLMVLPLIDLDFDFDPVPWLGLGTGGRASVLTEAACGSGRFSREHQTETYLLKTPNLFNLLGNMGYMSVKDENFPRAQGVLRGKERTPFSGVSQQKRVDALERLVGSEMKAAESTEGF